MLHMSLPKEVQITDASAGALDFNFMALRLRNIVVFFIFVSDQFHENEETDQYKLKFLSNMYQT